MRETLRRVLGLFSPGVWVVAALALGSSVTLAFLPSLLREPIQYWIFAKQHGAIYRDFITRWNRERPAAMRVELSLINLPVIEQRMLSGFLSGTPVASVIEVERSIAGRAFTGPLEDVGFVDLTDRLKHEGLLEKINPPSLTPWTSRGRIFGIPHDVHPVMLAYRADLVEAAGLDVSTIETWDDFFRVLRPLQRDLDGDGRIDRYLLSTTCNDPGTTEVLLLQAGGAIFTPDERVTFDTAANARILARLVPWYAGPQRMCRWADFNSASGQQMFVDGLVVAFLTPDWLAGTFKQQLPGLAGKLKLMPLPAFERGGRRTSAFGGTMLGLAKISRTPAADWEFAKALYLSREMSDALFRSTCIISPFKSHWVDNPAYAAPDPYFCGQAVGNLYVALAPDVPARTSSPYNTLATRRLSNCLSSLVAYAEKKNAFDSAVLEPEARRLLAKAQRDFSALVGRNVFLSAQP